MQPLRRHFDESPRGHPLDQSWKAMTEPRDYGGLQSTGSHTRLSFPRLLFRTRCTCWRLLIEADDRAIGPSGGEIFPGIDLSVHQLLPPRSSQGLTISSFKGSSFKELPSPVLRLSEWIRTGLASNLLRSLDPPSGCLRDTAESFGRELGERIDAVRSGTPKLSEWDECDGHVL